MEGAQKCPCGRSELLFHSTSHRSFVVILVFCLGRPGDTDGMGAGGGLAISTFARWGQLSGHVPMIGITTGYCFAGYEWLWRRWVEGDQTHTVAKKQNVDLFLYLIVILYRTRLYSANLDCTLLYSLLATP